MTDRITANIGLRWDRNDGVDSNGLLVADSSAFSPRLGVVWDPAGDQRWSVTGSVAKYVAGLLNSIADQTSPAGNSDQYNFVYTRARASTPTRPRACSNAQAIQMVFDWFNANGGPTLPLTGSPSVRGVTPQDRWSRSTRRTSGSTRPASIVSSAAALRCAPTSSIATTAASMSSERTPTTGTAVDTRSFAPASVQGRAYDLTLLENDNDGLLNRQYTGLSLQAQYRAGTRIDFGGNYTISRAWGNVEGETVPNGPITAGASGREAVLSYPGVSRRVELPDRRSVDRSASSRAAVAERHTARGLAA